MRTKQLVRAKRDHFMHRDCVESEALERIAPLRAEHKQPNNLTGAQPRSGAKVRPEGKGRSAWPSESPTSVFEPGVAPTSPLTLPVAVDKPSLPSTAVWGSRAPPTLHLATATAAAKSERGDDGHAASAPDAKGKLVLQACLSKASPKVLSAPIPEQRYFGGRPFPLTLVPASAPNSMADWHLAGWARENRDALLELVEGGLVAQLPCGGKQVMAQAFEQRTAPHLVRRRRIRRGRFEAEAAQRRWLHLRRTLVFLEAERLLPCLGQLQDL